MTAGYVNDVFFFKDILMDEKFTEISAIPTTPGFFPPVNREKNRSPPRLRRGVFYSVLLLLQINLAVDIDLVEKILVV
jgi:hypothetical protein